MVRIILIGIVSVSSISGCRGGRYFRPVMGFRGFNFQLKMGSTKCCGPIAYQLHVHDIQSCMVWIRFGLGCG